MPDGARQRLLDAIKARKGDEEVISLLRELAKSNATANAARSPALPGRWNLLWASSNAEARLPVEYVLGKKSRSGSNVFACRALQVTSIAGSAAGLL